MLIRVEFAEHKTARFSWLLRLCKKFPSYKQTVDGVLTVYSIEFTEKDIEQFRAVHDVLYGLRSVAYFLDGKLIPKDELFSAIRTIRKDQSWDRWIEKMTRAERTRALFHPRPNDAFLARLKKYGLMGNDN